MSAADGSVFRRDADVALLFEQHRRSILAYCRRRLDSDEDAEDAMQTTFVHALRSIRRGVRPHVEAAWLFAIARNVCRERWRSTQRRGASTRTRDVDELADVLAAPEPDDDELFDLDAALGRLAERQREALLLREWRGLSYEEIARRLEVSESAVETLLFRARRSLAHELEQDTRGARGALGLLLGMPRRLWHAGVTTKLAAGAAAVSVAVVAGGVAPRFVDHDRAPVRHRVVRAAEAAPAGAVVPHALATQPVRRHRAPARRHVAQHAAPPAATTRIATAVAVRSATPAAAPVTPPRTTATADSTPTATSSLPAGATPPPAAPVNAPADPAPQPPPDAPAPPVPAQATVAPVQADLPPVTLQTPPVQLPAPLPSVPPLTVQTPAVQVAVPAPTVQVTVPPLQSLVPPVQLPPVLP